MWWVGGLDFARTQKTLFFQVPEFCVATALGVDFSTQLD
jgi:hypothetical protein